MICHSFIHYRVLSFIYSLSWIVIHLFTVMNCHSFSHCHELSFIYSLSCIFINLFIIMNYHSFIACHVISFIYSLSLIIIHLFPVMYYHSLIHCHSVIHCHWLSFLHSLSWIVIYVILYLLFSLCNDVHRKQLKSLVGVHQDSSESYLESIGHQALLSGKVYVAGAIEASIDKITAEDVNKVR